MIALKVPFESVTTFVGIVVAGFPSRLTEICAFCLKLVPFKISLELVPLEMDGLRTMEAVVSLNESKTEFVGSLALTRWMPLFDGGIVSVA
jgi:hypothetical protein